MLNAEDRALTLDLRTIARQRAARLTLDVPSADQLHASIGPAGVFHETLAHSPLAGHRPAPDWPPMFWEASSVGWLIARLAEHPHEPFWRPWFISLEGLIIGTIGFKGPPDAAGGMVEIGYSVVASHWRRGIATEAVATMIEWAGRDPRVRGVRGHTLAGDPASGGVLLKNGFTLAATIDDPDDGRLDRYERGL